MDNYYINIIIPLYNECRQFEQNIAAIENTLKESKIGYGFILVDDGSTDATWDMVKNICEKNIHIKAIKLSRNFGKEAAICAGLEHSNADAVITMDADLQHPPSLIPGMVRLWNEGYHVVECIKTHRGKESLFSKASAYLFYKLLKKLSGYNLENASDFKLLDKKVVDAWRLMNEKNTFFRGMSSWVGFNRTSLPFSVPERACGESKWSILGLFKLAINAVTSFSSLPLHLVTFLGIGFLAGAFILGVQTLARKFAGQALTGFTTVILLQLIIGSALMISLGIIGTYIAKIYDEVKGRPRYIISERLNIKDTDGGVVEK